MTHQIYPVYMSRLYPLMGFQAHGAFSNLWIHKTYRLHTSKHDPYHHCGHIVTKYYYPYNKKSRLQQAWRDVLKTAVDNWQGFNENTKNVYNEFAKNLPLLGYNRYISLYLLANYPPVIPINWAETRPAGDVNALWRSLACDSDGSFLMAGVTNGRLYISSDGGANWAEVSTCRRC